MLQTLALLFFAGGLFANIEWLRAHRMATSEVRVRLRRLWRGWPTPAFTRYAYHETSEPTRSRLRRSAWAGVACLALWLWGAAAMGLWWLALLAALPAGWLLRGLLHP